MVKPIDNRVDTIFIHVSDLKRSVLWYGKLLGVEVPHNEINSPIYTFDMGPGRPGLTLDDHRFDENYHFEPSNQPLFNLSTSNIDLAFQHVLELGAVILTEIQVYPDVSDFCFSDPDGNVLMVCTCIS